jgi:excisionase family DNA binding protein
LPTNGAHKQRATIMQTEILPSTAGKKRGTKVAIKGKAAKAKPLATAAKVDAPIVDTDYMTTREAAAYLRLSRQFLEAARYRGDGSGPPYIKIGRSVRYRKTVLDSWMSAHDHSPSEPIK